MLCISSFPWFLARLSVIWADFYWTQFGVFFLYTKDMCLAMHLIFPPPIWFDMVVLMHKPVILMVFVVIFVLQEIDFNIYSPNTSSTSSKVPCNSDMCEQQKCSSSQSNCPYQVIYLSNGTSSTGILVEDVLHLTTDDDKTDSVKANITFGFVTFYISASLRNTVVNASNSTLQS